MLQGFLCVAGATRRVKGPAHQTTELRKRYMVHGTPCTIPRNTHARLTSDTRVIGELQTSNYAVSGTWYTRHRASKRHARSTKQNDAPPLPKHCGHLGLSRLQTPRRKGCVFPVTKASGRRGGETPELRATDSCSYAWGIRIKGGTAEVFNSTVHYRYMFLLVLHSNSKTILNMALKPSV